MEKKTESNERMNLNQDFTIPVSYTKVCKFESTFLNIRFFAFSENSIEWFYWPIDLPYCKITFEGIHKHLILYHFNAYYINLSDLMDSVCNGY